MRAKCYWIVICSKGIECKKSQIELAGLRWHNITDCLLIIQYWFQFQTWSYKQNAFTSGNHVFWESVNLNFSQMPYMYCNKKTARHKKADWNCYYTALTINLMSISHCAVYKYKHKLLSYIHIN